MRYSSDVLFGLLAAALCGSPCSIADTIDVPGDFASIAAAMDAAVDGDLVLVAPGTYLEGELNFAGKKITVSGTAPDDSVVVEATVVEAQGERAVVFSSGEDTLSILRGIALRGSPPLLTALTVAAGSRPVVDRCLLVGSYWYDSHRGIDVDGAAIELRGCRIREFQVGSKGAGISLSESTARIVGCRIESNITQGDGAGILAEDSSVQIVDTVIRDNITIDEGREGGGIAAFRSRFDIRNSRIVGNQSVTISCSGGGMSLGRSEALLVGCAIDNNHAEGLGGGILSLHSRLHMIGCTVNDNDAWDGGDAIYGSGVALLESCVVIGGESGRSSAIRWRGVYLLLQNCTVAGNTSNSDAALEIVTGRSWIRNTILYDNSPSSLDWDELPPTVVYSNIEGGWPGAGNIDADPHFFSAAGFDVLLRPGSPCIDTGTPNLEDALHDGAPRWPDGLPNGPRSDMGAYGGPENGSWWR
ncbi:MAG: hypothetical protein CME06_10840 [Gemmatimonadetes bacterium]|nr:hypothetical protein [Gemmatimonadota bacterium]